MGGRGEEDGGLVLWVDRGGFQKAYVSSNETCA